MLMIFLGVCQRSPGGERRRQGGLCSPPGCAPEGGGPAVLSGLSSGSRRVPALPGTARWHRERLSPPRLRRGRRGEAPRPPSREQRCGAWAARDAGRAVPGVPANAGGQQRAHPKHQPRLTWGNRPGTCGSGGLCVLVWVLLVGNLKASMSLQEEWI